MAKEKTTVKFSFTSTGVTYSRGPDGSAAAINLEGTATGFGTVLGTLTLFGDAPGAKTGESTWVGTAYLDNGEEVQGTSEGFYEPAGKHKWRVRGTLRTSTGAMFNSDGIISLDGRTYKGNLTSWD
jgi:hypothetical protein